MSGESRMRRRADRFDEAAIDAAAREHSRPGARSDDGAVLRLIGASRRFGEGETAVTALRGADLDVFPGQLVAVMGASGSGKSTLLSLAGGLAAPSSGQVIVEGRDLAALSRQEVARLRRRSLGFVFQDFNLIPTLTALENVTLPLELDGFRGRVARRAGVDALDDDTTRPQSSSEIDGFLVEQPHPTRSREIYVAPATAAAEGIVASPSHVIATYDAPPTDRTMDRLSQDLNAIAQRPGLGGVTDVWAEREDGPPDPAIQFWLIIAGASALVIGAGAVAIGLSRVERRADDATLSAVGGGALVRRSVSFWQGLVIAGLGCATGTAAGILPVWGVTLMGMGSDTRMSDVPWPLLAVLGIGLPVAIAAVSWLVPPQSPDLSRRRTIS